MTKFLQDIPEDTLQRAREMADLIRRFVSGDVGQYEWDDFMGISFSDPRLERARIESDHIVHASAAENNDDRDVRLLRLADRLDLKIK